MKPSLSHWTLISALALSGGCVYYNGLYNARLLYEKAERARLAGNDSVARAAYAQAMDKAGRSYRAEPEGGWADEALYLMGRAQLRQRRLVSARASLERALQLTDDEDVRLGCTLYLGVIALSRGERERAEQLFDAVLRRGGRGGLRAEAHLWRARLLLGAGRIEGGWRDLERAAEADDRYRVAAALERLAWGIVHGDGGRASAGAQILLSAPGAYARADTIEALVLRARADWGAGSAADLLEGAEDGEWPPLARDRLVLLRARLRADAGDPRLAREAAALVASGAGAAAVDARLLLARLEASSATTVEELELARPILLPAVGDPRVLGRLRTIRSLQILARRGREDPTRREALFAAAEVARDRLGADGVATTLFLEYAERAPTAPWAGKALLAGLATAGDDDERRRAILARLADRDGDPYVILWRSGSLPPGRFQTLEQGLRFALAAVLAEVSAMDVGLPRNPDTLREREPS